MTFGRRLRSRIWRGSVEDEVDAELGFHVEMRARELEARGMSPADAHQAALRRFGDIERVNATCRSIGKQRDRGMRRTEFLTELTQDLTFAARQLIHHPGFTIVALLTLSLGIGATAAIFSAVQAVVLRPLPVPEPSRILAVYTAFPQGRGAVSAGNYVDGIEPVSNFAATTAIRYSSFNLADTAQAERIIGAQVTAGFFGVFGVAPAHGRVFTADEDRPGGPRVVVLSHRLWSRRFGGNPSVLGTQVRLGGQPYEVIGVMPATFDFTAQTEELWVPMAFTPERKAMHDEHQYQVYARLASGATSERALAELHRNAEGIRVRFPKEAAELDFAVAKVMDELVGDYRRRLFTLLGAVGLVMLIACGNIANLLLARATARSGELAIRVALGAGRGRIIRQLLTESLLLATLAGAAGIALASWGIQALTAAAPPGVPRLEQASINPLVLTFTGVIVIVSAIVFGLAPAVRASRTDVQGVLKEGGRGMGAGVAKDRVRTAVIIGELALALVLLIGAGLLIRSAMALERVSPGFDASHVLAARLSLPPIDYKEPERVLQTFEQVAAAASAVPGVRSASLTSQVPMGPGGNGNGLIPEGKPFDIRNSTQSRLRIVTPGYFDAMGISVIRGRALNAEDRRGALKVMVVSESLARALFADSDPIGRRVACCEPGPDGKGPDYKTVVGVAADTRWRGPAEPPSPEFYLPAAQIPAAAWDWIQRTLYVTVRTTADPAAVINPLRSALAPIVPGVPLFDIRTMEQRIGASLQTARFNTLLLTILGGLGVVLAIVGIYGVIAYFVTRRTREIGVRMALGATRRDVVALVVRQAVWPVGLGVAAGLIASVMATRLLRNQLFGIGPNDPMTFAGVAVAVMLVALTASFVPALRAAGSDPTDALRTQ
jgi:putative ABC transport system permease protein